MWTPGGERGCCWEERVFGTGYYRRILGESRYGKESIHRLYPMRDVSVILLVDIPMKGIGQDPC